MQIVKVPSNLQRTYMVTEADAAGSVEPMPDGQPDLQNIQLTNCKLALSRRLRELMHEMSIDCSFFLRGETYIR